jgi:23S rRNA pseudouridine1911/1915/1917 synthase
VSRGETPPTPEPEAPPAASRRSFVVGPADAGVRLDRFLQAQAPDLSRTRLQALIATGRVHVTGGLSKASHRLRDGARVTIEVPPPEPVALTPEPIPLAVVYEDAALLVVNKPTGLVVHPGAGHRTGTLVHALLAHCGPALSGIGGVRRPGIVHRLDRGTSGLLVVAKTDHAHLALARQLKARTVERRYLALVHGRLPHAAGVIESAIGRDPRDRLRMAVRPAGAGRPAVTRYRVLERFARPGPFTLVEVTLGTGRTHQIRVHLAHIGHPLMGDSVYGPHFKTKATHLAPRGRAALTALDRQALHAYLLVLEHPRTGEILRWESPLPEDLLLLQNTLRAAL